MTSKWIEDVLYRVYDDGGNDVDSIIEVLNRIDKLLRKAMLSTDDENLSDQIRKEISNE